MKHAQIPALIALAMAPSLVLVTALSCSRHEGPVANEGALVTPTIVPAPMAEAEPPASTPDAGIGGLIGTQSGSGGLGSRGTGQGGGGGTAEGIGGIGTKGRGAGASGYGTGGGSFGAKGERPDIALPDPVASRDGFTDHGVNPTTLVSDDALSTFAIDVDTASFTVSRRLLTEGRLPPVAAVRAEEYVNALDYDYPAPQARPFGVHLEAMPDPFRPGRHLLRVGVQGAEPPPEQRLPVHLTFLVDVSGSMAGSDRLPLARQSLHLLVDRLHEDDTVALATYAGRVAQILPPTPLADKRAVHEAIESLDSGGSTAMGAGIDLAYQMAWQGFQAGHENRVIILSDGDANVGNSSWEEMLRSIKGYADKGVTLSTIGFGMGNYQDTLMEQLADKGDGQSHYIEDLDEAKRLFVDELSGSLVTIGRDLKIQVEWNPESVLSYRLIGYENRDVADADFRNDRADGGEIGAGHDITALYEVMLAEGYDRQLATVRVRWESPGADKRAEEAAFPFPALALKERVDQASPETRLAAAAATLAEVLRDSPHAEEVDLAALEALARGAARPGKSADQDLVTMIGQARALGAGGPSLTRR